MLVPQPRSLHVPLIQLSADRLFAVTPHHHACGACVEFLQLLREPVCPVPAERELPKALQQPATVQTTQIPRAQHQLPPEHLCYSHDLHQEEYTCRRQRTWPKNRSLHLASVLQTEQNLSIRVAGDLHLGSIEAFSKRVWAVIEADGLLLLILHACFFQRLQRRLSPIMKFALFLKHCSYCKQKVMDISLIKTNSISPVKTQFLPV